MLTDSLYNSFKYTFTEMDIGLEMEVDNERNEDWKNGRRVVELEKMAKEMFCDICNQWLHLKDTVKESRYGLGSVLRVKCSACGSVKKLNLGKTNDDGGFDVNRKAVIGKKIFFMFK